MENKVRAALIGVGVMGKKYAEMIVQGKVQGMVLNAVVARRPEIREWAEKLLNTDGTKPCVYANTDELFEQPDNYDAVIIVTPHKTHPELAIKAFQLGKHVMCDKPAGVTIGQAADMTAASKEYKRIYAMMFHQRKYPKYLKIKDILDSGEIGRLERIMLVNSRYYRTAHYHASGGWRSSWNGEGGGALINQGAHILDIWQWLFGMPESIYADIPFGKYNDFNVDDEATIYMRYPENLTAVFMLTTGEAVWEERLEIVGSRGRLLLEDDTLHIWRYSADSEEYIKNEQVNSRENLSINEEVISFEKAEEPYTEMLENFAEAVVSGNEQILTAPGEEAINQLMLTNSAYYSAWTGQRVTLPIDAELYEAELRKHCEMEKGYGL
ncbi:MAG: Gfo/Idh/MocA family oxidoreductase [Lachnospira sp.]|nr:Gfo/Idh/MocA family oxidoreductase [Lachnospira sp.]